MFFSCHSKTRKKNQFNTKISTVRTCEFFIDLNVVVRILRKQKVTLDFWKKTKTFGKIQLK